MLLTNHEKQFLSGLVQYMMTNNSAQYYETANWETAQPIMSAILTTISNAPKDPNGASVYDRYGYHHYDLWSVELNSQAINWILSTLSQWMDANGYYCPRPSLPGNFPPTAQIEIVKSLIEKLNTA
jgi:hypothetical protein